MLPGLNVGLISPLPTNLSNALAHIFQVFINIHEYANETIFILGPLDERICQIVSMMM